MSAADSHAEPPDKVREPFNLERTAPRIRSHSAGSVSTPSTSRLSSPQRTATEVIVNPMESDVVTPRKSDTHPVVKFKPCLVLRPSSSSSPRSTTRFSGHSSLHTSLIDPSCDQITSGCLSDPLPFSTASCSSGHGARGAAGSNSAGPGQATPKSSSLKPCRLLGRAHRAGFSSPPPPSHLHATIAQEPRRRHSYMELMKKRASQSRSPPPPENVVRALDENTIDSLLMNGDEVTEEDESGEPGNRVNTFGLDSHRSYAVRGENHNSDVEPAHRHDSAPPLAQAVVAALKHNQHHLFRSTTTNVTTTATTTTSTASSSRFSPAYLSDENEAGSTGRSGRRRHVAQEEDSDTNSVSYGDDDDEEEVERNYTDAGVRTSQDGTGIELDRESGYGASCSSSSVRLLRFSSRRDKRRQKRRVQQRRASVGTSTAETHSSPCEEEEEGFEDRAASLVDGVRYIGRGRPGDSIGDGYTLGDVPPVSMTTAGEFGDLGSSARRMISSRNTTANRHKRNRVRILDEERFSGENHTSSERQPSGNRRRIRSGGFHPNGELRPEGQNGDNEEDAANDANDDDSESPGPVHTHSSLPSYPCAVHRYSIDTGSAPSIPTSDTEANRLEPDPFDAPVDSSPVPNLSMPGLAPGAAMPPPPNAVPSASILVMSTNSQTHHNSSSFSPYTSGRGAWHTEMSPGFPLAHGAAYLSDTQTDTYHSNGTGPPPQPCLCSTHNHEAHAGWWESANCSWYGPGETSCSSAFHPAPLGARSRQSSINPSALPSGWIPPVGSGGPYPCRPSTSMSATFGDETSNSPPPPLPISSTEQPHQQQQQQQLSNLSEPPPDHIDGPHATAWADDPSSMVAATTGTAPRHSILSSWGMVPLRTRTSPGSSFSTTRSQRLAESGRSHSAMEQRRYSAPCPEPIYEVNLASPVNSLVHTPTPTRVSLVVDNVRFIVDAQILQAHPDTMLGRMISSHFSESSRLVASAAPVPGTSNQRPDLRPHPPDILVAQNSNISAHLFRAVLDYYLLGHISCPPGVPVQELKETCDYFLIPFDHHTVRCANLRAFLHELSNDGARANFAAFLESHILSLLVKCARTGERECHVVIVTDDETIVWDPEFPPQMPENELQSHIIYSTHMFRFLKYIENREVAKQVLLERGLKKIRIGIEGYPTCKDRMKFRPGLRPEAIYNYVQCPFLRMSWEEEENKSRHVDFQCVKSKSVSDLTTGLEQAVVDPLPPPHHHLATTRSPIRLISPERPDLRLASFAAQVDSLDPDGPLVLEGTAATAVAASSPPPPLAPIDADEASPAEPSRSRIASSPLPPNRSPIPADRDGDEDEEELEPRAASTTREPPNSSDPSS